MQYVFGDCTLDTQRYELRRSGERIPLLEILTAEQPLVLVLEDLHWSDTATLEWRVYVARRRDTLTVQALAKALLTHQQALGIARRQQAKSWELRVAAAGQAGRGLRDPGANLRLVHGGVGHTRPPGRQNSSGGHGVGATRVAVRALSVSVCVQQRPSLSRLRHPHP